MGKHSRLTVTLFLILFIGLLAFFIWQRAANLNNPLPPALPNGVAAGDVTQNSAVLWAHSQITGPLTFAYGVDLARNPILVKRMVISPLLPITVAVAGLTPNTLYHYRVSTVQGDTVDGQFQTAAPVGVHTGLRFGVSGDWRGDLAPYVALQNAPVRGLKFFVELGDTIYADFSSPAVPANQATTLTDYRLKHSEDAGESAVWLTPDPARIYRFDPASGVTYVVTATAPFHPAAIARDPVNNILYYIENIDIFNCCKSSISFFSCLF